MRRRRSHRNTPQSVPYGSAKAFTKTRRDGIPRDVGGTCPAGALVGNMYTTGALVANCTVVVTSTAADVDGHPVRRRARNLSPNTARVVNYGATQAFTVTASPGYSLSPVVGGTLPGGRLRGQHVHHGHRDRGSWRRPFTSTLNWAGLRQQGAVGQQTEGTGVAVDASGNVYVSGFTQGSSTAAPRSVRGTGFIAKYDASGTLVWCRNLGVASGHRRRVR